MQENIRFWPPCILLPQHLAEYNYFIVRINFQEEKGEVC